MTENQCPYVPTQGTNKGIQCLLPAGHTTFHVYDPGKIPHESESGDPSAFTAEEIADAISEEEIRKRSEALHDAQELWERAALRAIPKMPCPECTGRGAVIGGSLGDHCATCNGKRVVDDDASDIEFPMPDFKALRDPLTAYGDALIHRRHGRAMALPPAESVPTLDQISALRAQGKEMHRQLAAGAPPKLPALPSGDLDRSGLETEGGVEDTASDAEIDAIEAEIVGETKKGRR